MRYLYLIILPALLTLFSCEEIIDIDIPLEQNVPIIEGLISTQENESYFKLKYAYNFYEDEDSVPFIKDAQIVVKEVHQGRIQEYPFVWDEDLERYIIDYEGTFTGKVGAEYQMYILWQGKEYIARDKMPTNDVKVTLRTEVNQHRLNALINFQGSGFGDGRIYDLFVNFNEPADERNYYQIHFPTSANGVKTSIIYLYDDQLFSSSLKDFQAPQTYTPNSRATIDVYSYSEETFAFFKDVQGGINNPGGLFSAIPSNPQTNIQSNSETLGYFLVANVVSESIVAEADSVTLELYNQAIEGYETP